MTIDFSKLNQGDFIIATFEYKSEIGSGNLKGIFDTIFIENEIPIFRFFAYHGGAASFATVLCSEVKKIIRANFEDLTFEEI